MFDRPLALAGWLAAAIRRRGRWVPLAVVVGLATASLIPFFIVGLKPQPADISFADLEAQRIPAMTSWFRLTGDLRAAPDAGEDVYVLTEPSDAGRSVTIVSDSPLATGPTEVTGRISGELSVAGSFTTLEADVPTEPARHDPWLLFSLPAIAALVVVLGLRLGYPVSRRDGRARSRPIAPGPGLTLPARWSGWIGNESASVDAMRSCTVAVAGDADVSNLTLSEADSTRTVSTRRASPKQRLRICRIGGSRPALHVHAPSADVVLEFDDALDRDRLAAALG